MPDNIYSRQPERRRARERKTRRAVYAIRCCPIESDRPIHNTIPILNRQLLTKSANGAKDEPSHEIISRCCVCVCVCADCEAFVPAKNSPSMTLIESRSFLCVWCCCLSDMCCMNRRSIRLWSGLCGAWLAHAYARNFHALNLFLPAIFGTLCYFPNGDCTQQCQPYA